MTATTYSASRLVGHPGLEPGSIGLKGRCSTFELVTLGSYFKQGPSPAFATLAILRFSILVIVVFSQTPVTKPGPNHVLNVPELVATCKARFGKRELVLAWFIGMFHYSKLPHNLGLTRNRPP